MTQQLKRDYFKRETAEVAQFTAALRENAVNNDGTFDSAAADDFILTATNQATGVKVPKDLQHVLDEAGEKEGTRIVRAVLDGVDAYETQHGVSAPADVVEQALHLAYATTDDARRRYALDSATSLHHDQMALQPNRAVVSILATLGEAIPFAHYLPSDIGSNEAILAILSHQAGSTYGAYAQGGLLDGAYSGDSYVSSSRTHTASADEDDGSVAGKLTTIQDSSGTCAQNAASVKLLRGRTLVYVGGKIVAREMDSTGSGASAISGKVVIGNNEYAIGGSINTDTGAFTLTTSPKLPAAVPVVVEGFIDYERAPELTPSIITAVDTFKLHAKPWRVLTQQSIDSRTQMNNELGLDPYSESVISIQAQAANERHYEVLNKAMRVAAGNQSEFDYGKAATSNNNGLFNTWCEFAYPVALASQRMAIATLGYGITHLYVGARVAAILQGLPSTVFQPSGLPPRAGIYRLGRLFGQYEVYFTPKGLTETENSAQVLAIGRSPDVARSPFVLGDAVPATILPLAVGSDLRQGAGFYGRGFTSVNPHAPSASGAALINIVNM